MTPTDPPIDWEPRIRAFAEAACAEADPAHGVQHLARVVKTAKALAAAEGADPRVVVPAAWLHDCVAVAKNSPDRPRASALSADRAVEFLVSIGHPERFHPAIAHAIVAHSFSANVEPRTVEAMVVQDADRLDALGAIGLARCLMLGGAMGRLLHHPTEPVPVNREPDERRYTLDHFHTKLFKLPAMMRTEAGKREAQRRADFLLAFQRQLLGELE